MSDPDRGPMVKALESHYVAYATGASDGTMAGNNGVQDRRKDQEKLESSQRSSSSSDTNRKVICTRLVQQGSFDRSDYLLGARYVEEHLTERHVRGYHSWALPVVRQMRRSPRATAFWRALAQARADHIAFLYGDASRRNRFGAFLCAIGHPACYLIGGLVGEQDWRSLYREGPHATNR